MLPDSIIPIQSWLCSFRMDVSVTKVKGRVTACQISKRKSSGMSNLNEYHAEQQYPFIQWNVSLR